MRVIATVVAVGLGIAATANAEVTDAQIEKARSGTLTSSFQDDMPGFEPADGSGSAGRGESRQAKRQDRPQRDSARRVDTREYQERDADGGGPVSSLLTVFMWGLLAVGLGLVIFWFASEMSKSGEDPVLPAEDKDAAVKAATLAIIDKPLGDADELAARGEFAEAIHTLLLRTLHELARSAMLRVERSHTSREILARVPLLADAREALGMLITYVELTHFGDDPANAADYAKCREQFNRFAQAFRVGLAVQQRQGGGTALAS